MHFKWEHRHFFPFCHKGDWFRYVNELFERQKVIPFCVVFTNRKRSLGQGNVFTRISVQGVVSVQGGLCTGEFLSMGSLSRGVS